MADAEALVLELQREISRLEARVDYLETLECGGASGAPTPILLTGFEHGVAPPSASGNLGLYDITVTDSFTIVTTPVHSGTYALQLAQTALRNTGWNFSALDGIVWRFYIRFPTSLPAATVVFAHIVIGGGGGLAAWIRFNQATGKFNVIWGGTTGSQDSAVSVAVDTWYRIDLKIVTNIATRTIDWQVDGVAQTQSTSTEAPGTITGIRFGHISTQTLTCVFDDLLLSATMADYPIGAGNTELIVPTSDGTHNAGANIIEDQTGADIDGTTAYNLIDEIPISGTTDYIRQFANDATRYAEVNFGNTVNTTILGVMGEANVASSSAGFACNGIMVVIRSDTTEIGVLGTPGSPESFTSTGPFYKRAVITAPTGDWTLAEVNALKGRIGFSTDTNPIPRFHAFALEVAYV